jgi:hypothetical protein
LADEYGVRIENLAAFRSALKSSIWLAPRDLTVALTAAGAPVVAQAAAESPRRSGALAGSYRASVRGVTGYITSGVPYGAGAEWGARGKWTGFGKYGSAGSRFAGRAIQDKEAEVELILERGLRNLFEIQGWATGAAGASPVGLM